MENTDDEETEFDKIDQDLTNTITDFFKNAPLVTKLKEKFVDDKVSKKEEDTEEAEGRAEKVDLYKIDEDLTNTVTDFLTNSPMVNEIKERFVGGTTSTEKQDEQVPAPSTIIPPRLLVGKAGLDRIMSYKPGSASVQKCEFEYKETGFGRIFNRDNIGKYSGKIKQICESIMNSTGVVLVYSQYIDGGLVPIALALEELGFTRGGNLKSLFKTPPVENIDAITLKKKSDTEGSPFSPAHYAMITGEKSLSPNNSDEVKRLTSVDNKNGEKIKVVLISQAGSEGLDFKFIRQVHILEPWYNMNRIEQIIGRAVRTCSHKDLPFKERNVELYLYGTFLENKQIEAADLYIYRHAESKAVDIGRVSRVLKSCAVDCLLNFEQMGFTVENMNQTVEQELSSKKTIQYQVGDRPYTAICDYMESCQYKCSPDITLQSSEVKDYTYTEAFIMMTTEKIIHRIKSLFKERFVYTKEDLVAHINIIKVYPPTQINAALSQLVDDKSEYVSDKYGRLGNIINIGDMYLFQPLELKQENISTFDRRVPIPYKRDKLLIKNLEFKKDILDTGKTMNDERIAELIADINNNFVIGHKSTIIMRGETNWYKFCSQEIDFFKKLGFKEDILTRTLVNHIIESLVYEDTLLLLKYISNEKYNSIAIEDTLIKYIREYFDEKYMRSGNIEAILLANPKNNPSWVLVVKNLEKGEFVWTDAKRSEILQLRELIKERVIDFEKNISKNMAQYVGFMSQFKSDNTMVFKVKNYQNKRSTGARCDQAPRESALRQILDIFSQTDTDEKIVALVKTKKKTELCVAQEIYLRYLQITKQNSKTWFVTPVQAIILKI